MSKESTTKVTHDIQMLSVTVIKAQEGVLIIHAPFRKTCEHFDLGGATEPDFAKLRVTQDDLNTWGRYQAFMRTESSSPDYVHVSDNRLTFYTLIDEGKTTENLFVKNPIDYGNARCVLKSDTGMDVHQLLAASIKPEDSFESDIEEVVVSRDGTLSISGLQDDNRWEVGLPNLDTLNTIMEMDKGSIC